MSKQYEVIDEINVLEDYVKKEDFSNEPVVTQVTQMTDIKDAIPYSCQNTKDDSNNEDDGNGDMDGKEEEQSTDIENEDMGSH